MQFQGRQGDVLVREYDGKPAKDAKPVPPMGARTVISLGLVTGYSHTFAAAKTKLYRVREEDLSAHLEIKSKTSLEHHEHEAIPFKKGSHLASQQRQWTLGLMQRVAD